MASWANNSVARPLLLVSARGCVRVGEREREREMAMISDDATAGIIHSLLWLDRITDTRTSTVNTVVSVAGEAGGPGLVDDGRADLSAGTSFCNSTPL